jgi:hypothetical protein
MLNVRHCSLLEVLDVKGCDNLMYFLHDTVDVWYLSKLTSFRSMDISGNLVVRELGKYTCPKFACSVVVLLLFLMISSSSNNVA